MSVWLGSQVARDLHAGGYWRTDRGRRSMTTLMTLPDPEDSLRILHFLARQACNPDRRSLRRYDRKPKRVASRKLHVLQGLSVLARRWLVDC